MNIFIVESPNKVKKIAGFLGKDFKVMASVGHIIDLPPQGLNVDIKKNFAPTYDVIAGKEKVVEDIVDAAKKADIVYLATDPDREGEAISWHIASQLPKKTKIKRVKFNSITKEAVLKSLKDATDIDVDLVDAYETRRILDRLAGYKTSFTVKQATGGQSAGRVQSAALRILVELEKEILSFKPVIYYPIEAELLSPKKEKVLATIKKPEPLEISTEEEALKIIEVFKKKPIKVSKADKKEVNVNPAAPFTTSTLLQAASSCLGFNAASTTKLAQQLYEAGKISYIRTDSTAIVPEFVEKIREHIKTKYAKEYLPSQAIEYKNKIKNAQEAHEAIRPTDIEEAMPAGLTKDQQELYELIWRRTVSCQMSPAKVLRSSAEFACEKYLMQANGSKELFDGYRKVWTYTNAQDVYLPELNVADLMQLLDIKTERKETQPPRRYSEASFIKKIEDMGIGRPSTYKTILQTLVDREYIKKDNKALQATELGIRVIDFLVGANICFADVQFTAALEDKLQSIANKEMQKLPVLSEFWTRLQADLKTARSNKEANSRTEFDCPKCKNKLLLKHSRFGPFFSCEKYNDKENKCDYTASVGEDGKPKEKVKKEVQYSDKKCPNCGEKLIIRTSKKGNQYLGCRNWQDKKCKGFYTMEGEKMGFNKYKKKKEE